jgi:hypothetical protein
VKTMEECKGENDHDTCHSCPPSESLKRDRDEEKEEDEGGDEHPKVSMLKRQRSCGPVAVIEPTPAAAQEPPSQEVVSEVQEPPAQELVPEVQEQKHSTQEPPAPTPELEAASVPEVQEPPAQELVSEVQEQERLTQEPAPAPAPALEAASVPEVQEPPTQEPPALELEPVKCIDNVLDGYYGSDPAATVKVC